ncbi:CD276 antigen-like [Tachysurus vachellii]|uniref:CD276 antigen-like n=1 Tax=Tachysurus vachellii TaxID=175792 RepID=UPI00296AD7CB|nr:CD276 antigen-like [Tachysurus vachellii]
MQQTSRTFLLFWTILLSTRAEDVTVTCVWSSSCVLPCRSQYHDIIHWYKDNKQNSVHTFYDKDDHLEYQDGDFKYRTSLFRDQLSQGNISLLLQTIRTTDEGRYKCYSATSTDNSEQFIRLRVQAPVKEVDLNMKSDKISCGMKGVYPEPQISWYIDGSAEGDFSVEKAGDKEGLFSVSSVLSQSVKENTTYTCTISLRDKTQTASLRRENVVIMSGQDATIHCPVSQEISGNSNITLMFGNSSTILTYIQVSQFPTDTEWRGKKIHVALDGTVTIPNVENEEHTGVYRCLRVSALSRQEVYSKVQIKSENYQTGVIVGLAVLIFIILIAVLCWRCRKKIVNAIRKKQQTSSSENNRNSSNGNREEQGQESTPLAQIPGQHGAETDPQ